jgi:hypothetical protein
MKLDTILSILFLVVNTAFLFATIAIGRQLVEMRDTLVKIYSLLEFWNVNRK